MNLNGIKNKVAVATVALAAIAAGSIIAPAPASASAQSDWYWSNDVAKHRLKNLDLSWDNDTFDDVINASCKGKGTMIWNDSGTLRLYKHFVCAVLTDEGDLYKIRLHVKSKLTYTAEYLGK